MAAIPRHGKPSLEIRLWKGDITALAPGTTAITNAANSQMLGCFQPTHKCIDNVIHSWAGPRLRDECFRVMSEGRNELRVGDAVTTRAYCLPCEHVIHTVGPQLKRGSKPSEMEKQQLSQSYRSVLEEADRLQPSNEGLKSVALCCTSTGLFAFPADLAANIAVNSVAAWVAHHPETTITDIVFVTYTDVDFDIYYALLGESRPTWSVCPFQVTRNPSLLCTTIETGRTWLAEANTIIVSAGAGFSAADGLDYTSTVLFKSKFPGFVQYGFERLYDVFGFTDWPSESEKWGYYFTHLAMIDAWPRSKLYKQLIGWLETFGENAHVRTSNADGLFIANGWDEEKMSTPQGRYAFLQCVANCTPGSYWPSKPYLDAALPHLDVTTQILKDASVIPRCRNCNGDMFICVRAADWFNEAPYIEGEARWKHFRQRALFNEGQTVILELGVGLNTPGVLKWPNEDLVRQGKGRVKLVRVAVGSHAVAPWDLEEEDLSTYIDGDIKVVLPAILSPL